MTARVDNCCGDFANCWLHCEIRGAAARITPRAKFLGREPLQDGAIDLRTLVMQARSVSFHRIPVEPRRIGWLERLIAGPQGDPDLRSDFYSFLGCLACDTGLALLLIALMVAGHWVLEGRS